VTFDPTHVQFISLIGVGTMMKELDSYSFMNGLTLPTMSIVQLT